LEIGAGSALISRYIRNTHPNEVSIDIVEAGIGWSDYYKKLGINQVSTFFPFATEESYDYIHTSHWLEHVNSLPEITSHLKNLLKPNGLMFIEVPNCSSYFELDYYDTPHIHFFTKESIEIFFKNNGFIVLKSGEFGLTMQENLILKNRQTLDKSIVDIARESELKAIPRKYGSNLRILLKKLE
jgi:2-polyprenyl-3-methyl-5-hydroxy-6-metoxy-1,4-benzoquinol methylase